MNKSNDSKEISKNIYEDGDPIWIAPQNILRHACWDIVEAWQAMPKERAWTEFPAKSSSYQALRKTSTTLMPIHETHCRFFQEYDLADTVTVLIAQAVVFTMLDFADPLPAWDGCISLRKVIEDKQSEIYCAVVHTTGAVRPKQNEIKNRISRMSADIFWNMVAGRMGIVRPT